MSARAHRAPISRGLSSRECSCDREAVESQNKGGRQRGDKAGHGERSQQKDAWEQSKERTFCSVGGHNTQMSQTNGPMRGSHRAEMICVCKNMTVCPEHRLLY